ncbi:hypothetical protein [Rhodocyclus purpureus]|uniref:hypothetical protein n=1 Tax=Rhodocyclus purpureus TaxID=1067 RepID=UPI0019116F8D|nr:hypothetical protein [Rhodocyclus purpureus]
MKITVEKKLATVGESSRDVAGQGEHTELHSATQSCIANERNASPAVKLAVVDALLYVAEHTPPGFRSLRCNDIAAEHWTNTWAEYVVHLAKFSGVDALLANQGVFLIAERVMVCHEDELRRPASQVEPGWQRVKLCSIDGKARPHDREAPQILISPDEQCFLWQPEGGPKNQKRLTFLELLAELGEMGERLARFEEAA